MSANFLITMANNQDALASAGRASAAPCKLESSGKWTIALFEDGATQGHISSTECEDARHYLIGRIENINELKAMCTPFNSGVLTGSPAEVIRVLQASFGNRIFSIVDGAFAFITLARSGALFIVTDALGQMPVSYVAHSQFWISSKLRLVSDVAGAHVFDFHSESTVCKGDFRADDFLPIKNARKLKPGSVSKFALDGMHHPFRSSESYDLPAMGTNQRIPRDFALHLIDQLLKASVSNAIGEQETVGIPLSGGLDSSLITALASLSKASIKTFAIGTSISNEFEFSRKVAERLGTSHSEFVLSDEEICRGVFHSIYHHEIYDGLSAEIQSGLLNVYRVASSSVKHMLTGYGADLIFGGVLRPGMAVEQANEVLWQQVYRTRWTGEFSHSGAARFGLTVSHPFWTNRLIGFCRDLDPGFKVTADEVKPLLRTYAEGLDLLPHDIVWRRKIGIHEGSSINRTFAARLGLEPEDYAGKTRVVFSLYKAIMTHSVSADDTAKDLLSRCAA
jgi:carbapenam-3-carboxylate synthase